MWDGKAILLFTMSRKAMNDGEGHASLQCIHCSDPSTDIEGRFGYMCLGWSAGNEMDHTLEKKERREETKAFRVREGSRAEMLGTIEGSEGVVPGY